MKTLTIRLSDTLAAEIERESQERRLSKSDVVRERLGKPERVTPAGGGTGELIGEILRQGWQARVPSGAPRFRSPKKQKLAEIIREGVTPNY